MTINHLSLRIRVVVLAVLLVVAVPTIQANILVNKTICSMLVTTRTNRAAHAYHTPSFFASAFPNITWTSKYVNAYPGSAGDCARGWVINGTDCDAVIGPGTSARAIAMSPLVEVPWLDYSATSTELSDKSSHPTFSRVIPTDDVLATANGAVYQNFGWNRTNILCMNEPFGRSVTDGVTAAIKANGGVVDVSICLQASTSGDAVVSAMDDFYASRTRVLFIVAQGILFDSFEAECLLRNCTNDFVIYFSGERCPETAMPNWPGALCATDLVDPEQITGFLDSYYARDLTVERARLTELGWPTDTDLTTTSIYSQYAHDATHHIMSALHAYYLNGSCCGTAIEFMRAHVSQGATGTISLDEAGDRPSVDTAVYNANATGHWNVFATIRNGVFNYADASFTTITTRPDLVLFNNTYTSADTLPATAIPEDEIPIQVLVDNSMLVIATVVGVLMFLIIFAGIPVAYYLKNAGRRDLSSAPKDATKPFTLAFTDIQSSTNLWARIPDKMADAVDTHHEIIRSLIKKHKGYEVKTIGDSFMVAFAETKSAVEFAVGLQYDFFNHDWGHRAIDEVYQQLAEEKQSALADDSAMMASLNPATTTPLEVVNSIVPDPKAPLVVNDPSVWNGLRVRVGVHHGMGEIKFDQVSLGYDYYGTVVNTAARVEGVGNGGQVLITGAAFDDVSNGTHEITSIPNISTTSLGPQPLRGLDNPVSLHLVLPAGLVKREFAPLRLDFELDEEAESSAGGTDTQSRHSGASHLGSVIADSNITPEILAERSARRWKGEKDVRTVYSQLINNYHCIKALLSTSADKKKKEITDHCAAKWRLPLKASRDKKMTAKMQWDRHLMELVIKVTPSADAKQKLASVGQNLDASGMSNMMNRSSPGFSLLGAPEKNQSNLSILSGRGLRGKQGYKSQSNMMLAHTAQRYEDVVDVFAASANTEKSCTDGGRESPTLNTSASMPSDIPEHTGGDPKRKYTAPPRGSIQGGEDDDREYETPTNTIPAEPLPGTFIDSRDD